MALELPKLSIFLPSLRGGGVERTVVVLCRGLLEEGVCIDLVLSRAQGPFLSQIPDGVRIVDLGCQHVSRSLPSLAKYLREERPSYLFSAMNYVNITAILANELAGRPTHIIIREDTTPGVSFEQSPVGKGRLVPWLMRLLYRRAGTILAVSHGVADNLAAFIGMDRNRIQVIWNPVVDEDLIRKAQEPLPKEWAHLISTPFILGVGRLSRPKNFPDLLRAFATVRQTHPVRLIILGEGPDRVELEALSRELKISEYVDFPGFIDNPYAFMREARQFVLSSSWEGLPTVLIEALASGCPVVSTDCPSGPFEILEDGRFGTLVPVADVHALAHAICAALDAPMESEVLKKRSEEFSCDASVKKYLHLLRQIVDEKATQKTT